MQTEGLNRTRVELKRLSRIEIETGEVCLNRTRVELKLPRNWETRMDCASLNRTRVELKRSGGRQASPSVMRLNRTRVELKLFRTNTFQIRDFMFESNQSGIETNQLRRFLPEQKRV